VVKLLSKAKPPKPHITLGELEALDNLRKDNFISILSADEGKATVIMNKRTLLGKNGDTVS
jgi:hypothetical protein